MIDPELWRVELRRVEEVTDVRLKYLEESVKLPSMTDNVLETLQKFLQDVIAPDVRELKVRVATLETRMDERFASLRETMTSRFDVVDARFIALIAELRADRAERRAHIAAVGERLAVIETKLSMRQ